MKTIFRSMGLAMIFAAVGVTTASAQDACANVDDQTVLYTKVTANYAKTTIPEKTVAVEAGKSFLEKYGACATLKDQVDFVTAQVPAMEKWIAAQKVAAENKAMFARFDAGIQSEKYDEVYAAGKDILAKQPDNLNILIPLGSIGLYQSYAKNYKYNEDSLRYAQQALSLLKSGKELPKKNKAGVPVAGAFQFECTREDCISDLTYAVAYINYYAKNDKKAALPLYYEVSQNGKYKTEPRVYASIGSYYADEGAKIGQELADLIQKQKAAKTEAEKAAFEPEIQAKLGLFNGYTERIIDAYARAYTIAKSAKVQDKAYTDSLYKILQDTYRRRFDKLEGLDAYVSSTVAKPLPNPTTAVTPVMDPEPAKTTGATAPVSTVPVTPMPAATATATTIKPASSASVKPVASTATKGAAVPAAKTPVKKAAVKKKGTR